MPTPSDEAIESRLAGLHQRPAGDAPPEFIRAVRSRRRTVLVTRGSLAAGALAAGVALAVVLRTPAAGPAAPPPEHRLAIDQAPTAHPGPAEGSILALRRAWGEAPEASAWLAALPSADPEPEPDEPLRIADSARFLRGL